LLMSFLFFSMETLMRELALVNMPFSYRRMPSFALSQLAALVRRDLGNEFNVHVCYMSHDFSRFLGSDLYDAITGDLSENLTGIGDWLFRAIAFPDHEDNVEEYFNRYYTGREFSTFRETILRRRSALYGFCQGLADQYGLGEAEVVGFSSMFAQTVPSLAMAEVIKEWNPSTLTVMGGANCEAPMSASLAANTDQIDFYFSGPALRTFPEFLRCIVDNDLGRAHRIPGIVSKVNCTDPKYRNVIGAELDIDDYFEPDFSAFVESFDRMAAATQKPLEPLLFFETSRGCWWGERSHCTFCGLNGQSMTYRSMTPKMAVRQFEDMFKHAPWCQRFNCTDNIMPMDYLTEVFPKIAAPHGVAVFYEVKVGLDQEDLQIMSNAGVTEIQPGIEALNTHTLKLMHKGTSVFQNIQLLKNCVRFNINPTWNLLIGFPGEPESIFEKYVADLPLLKHLPPPDGCFPVRFDRYSPYFNRAAEYGLDLHPVDYYPLIYPFPEGELEDLAYYFMDRGTGEYMVAAAQWNRRLGDLVDEWRDLWAQECRPQLRLDADADGCLVTDSRLTVTRTVRLDPDSVALLVHLDRPCRMDKLAAELPEIDDLHRCLALLRDNGLLLIEGQRAMSLVLAKTGIDPMPRPRRATIVGARRRLPVGAALEPHDQQSKTLAPDSAS
jgi:ribosomal peptide maturation radical SAM protein 1